MKHLSPCALVLIGALFSPGASPAFEDPGTQAAPASRPTPESKPPTPPLLKPGTPEPLALSTLQAPRSKRLDQLRVSSNGALLFARWAVREGFDYRVVYLSTKKLLWSWKGRFKSDLWELALSPEGSVGYASLPLDAAGAIFIFNTIGKPLSLSLEYAGGAWANGGAWFGGPTGSYNADGRPRSGPALPDWTQIEPVLFRPGARSGTIRYVHAGSVFEWEGQGPPVEVGRWNCPEDGHFLGTQEPLQFSPDGRFVAWLSSSKDQLTVCDGNSGAEFQVAPQDTPFAWVDDHTLWRIDAGELVGLDVLTHESTPRLKLPEGAKAVALGASTHPPALFVGTEAGKLWRIPLTR